MLSSNPHRKSRWLSKCLLLGLLLPLGAFAQVKITFLPPPHQGTISLGIFNKAGTLVRTLFREATEKDFVVGLNGYITFWDGKDDAGQTLAFGKYAVRGYSVGEIEIEGIAYHCNQWMTEDDSPRLRELTSIHFAPEGALQVEAQTAANQTRLLLIDSQGQFRVVNEPMPATPAYQPKALPGVEKLIAACPGRDGSVWVIDRTASGVEVKQYAANDELLRRLSIPADEPEPWQIAASAQEELIFLLERTKQLQRLRGLALDTSAPSSPSAPEASNPSKSSNLSSTPRTPRTEAPVRSTWKTIFSKTIVNSDAFATIANQLGRDKPVVPDERFRVRLLPNPLIQDATEEINVRLAIDSEGTSFVDADGLLLRRITTTPQLKWAVMARDGNKALSIFQSDGAVVEEFRARKLANMMAFNAGEYSWAAAKPKPVEPPE